MNAPRVPRIRAAVMIGEACRFYGWTVEQVMRMQAVTFFAMVDAMKVLEAYEKIELIDIQAVSVCSVEYYEKVRDRYRKVISDQSSIGTVAPAMSAAEQQPAPPAARGVVLEGEDAKNFLFDIFAAKRAYG